jgi:hypothetical protein
MDFDGVIHSYTSGWKGADNIPDPPVPGAIAFLSKAKEFFDVQIFSSRSHQPGGIDAMRVWMRNAVHHHFDCAMAPGHPDDFDAAEALLHAISYPTEKPSAMISIDDRALTFMGVWPAIEELRRFQPWNKQPAILRQNSSGTGVSLNVRRTRFIQMANRLMPRWVRLHVVSN